VGIEQHGGISSVVCFFVTNGKNNIITSIRHEKDNISKKYFLFSVRFELQIPQRDGRLLDFCRVFAVKFRCFHDC